MKIVVIENSTSRKQTKVTIVTALIVLLTFSCNIVKNSECPEIPENDPGTFYTAEDSCKLYVYEFIPTPSYKSTVFLISGITGINHHAEQDLIAILASEDNRVVVIHPRGTGYSEGKRGDISNFTDFIKDYVEIIRNDKEYQSGSHTIFLFGHSMSVAFVLAVAEQLENIAGAILVNPPFILKKAKGMSPGFGQYLKYAAYMIFAKHKPVVNMAGDPSVIENAEDRQESELRQNDPLLVKYFSMYMMMESKKLINSMLDYSLKTKYPLLLIYGANDNIIDKKGCDLIFESWKSYNKKYLIIENGAHGKSTVILAKRNIIDWIDERKNE